MEIVGYVGYAALVILAIIWAIGVRFRLGAVTPTILMALYFVVGAVIIPVLGIDMLHALWVIPVGYLVGYIALIMLEIPGVLLILNFIARIYSGIIRIGIPRQMIVEAQEASMREAINNLFDKQE